MNVVDRVRTRLRYYATRLVAATPLEYWAKASALSRLMSRTTDFDLTVRVLSTNRFRRAIRPSFVAHPEGSRLLVLAAHQDDETIGAGGVLLHSARAGKAIQCLYVTDGATGLAGYTEQQVAGLRRKEASGVWQRLNGTEPWFWDLPNQGVELTRDNASRLARFIMDYQPDVLFIPFFLEDPNDHRKVNHLLYLAGKEAALPEMEVWAYQITTMISPNVGVDITDVIDAKTELNEMWQSQNQLFDYAHQSRGMAAANTLYYKGTHALPKDPRYVEVFFVTPLSEYLELIGSYFGSENDTSIYGDAE